MRLTDRRGKNKFTRVEGGGGGNNKKAENVIKGLLFLGGNIA